MSTWQLILATCVLLLIRRWWNRRNLPPGPFSLPFFGAIFSVKGGLGGRAFSNPEFAAKYGPVVRFDAMSKSYFIFNDFAQVKELFNKEVVSARGQNYFLQNIRGPGKPNHGLINTCGQPWTSHKRFTLKTLKDFGFGKNSLDEVIHEEADELINSLIEVNEANGEVKMDTNFNVAVINVLWKLVASKRFDPKEEETKELMKKLNEYFRGGNGLHIYMFLEFLRPYGPYVAGDQKHFAFKDMFRKYIEAHDKDHDPNAPRDLIDHYLTELKSGSDRDFNKEQLLMICVDLFQAGAETSSTTLIWAVLFMALNPEVQEKCQEEIETALGQRLPLKDDVSKLNYVNATIMEIQRLSCVAPLSLPHRCTDDVHLADGAIIPKGSPLLYNIKKFMLDPNVFKEANTFNPDRFLDSNGAIVKYDQFIPFGIGKRLCMGESLAKQQIFIFFTMLLQRINIGVPKHRAELPDKDDYTMGITTIPKPFYVTMTKRY